MVPNPHEALQYRHIDRAGPLHSQHGQPAHLPQAASPPAPKSALCAAQDAAWSCRTCVKPCPASGLGFRPLLPMLVTSTSLSDDDSSVLHPPPAALHRMGPCGTASTGCHCGKGGQVLPAEGLGVPAHLSQVEMAPSQQEFGGGGKGHAGAFLLGVLWSLSFS